MMERQDSLVSQPVEDRRAARLQSYTVESASQGIYVGLHCACTCICIACNGWTGVCAYMRSRCLCIRANTTFRHARSTSSRPVDNAGHPSPFG